MFKRIIFNISTTSAIMRHFDLINEQMNNMFYGFGSFDLCFALIQLSITLFQAAQSMNYASVHCLFRLFFYFCTAIS